MRLQGAMGWVLAVLGACTNPGTEETFDRKAMLEALADGVIIPSYQVLSAQTQAFNTAVNQLCTSPDQAHLLAAQDSWRSARLRWKATEGFRFGPVEELAARDSLDTWPTAFVFIDSVIAGTAALDEAAVHALPASQRGQPAAEYLLFGRSHDNAEVLTAFSTSPRRCAFLAALAADIHTVSGQVRDAWTGGYRAEFANAGDSSTTYPTLKAAVDQMVNQLIATSESVAGARLADPLGLRTGGTAQPNLVESPYAPHSTQDMLGILEGIAAVYQGADGGTGLGLQDYVASKDPDLDARVVSQMAAARSALQAIPPPLATAVVDQRSSVEAAYEQARALKRILGTEVVAALGVTLTFNDNDGD